MRKTTLTFLGVLFAVLTFGQANYNDKIIELGKAYNNFMFRNEPTKSDIKEMKANVPEEFKFTADFIAESITKKNKLLTEKFLSRPDDKVLNQIYIINKVRQNLINEDQIDNNKLIDSLMNKDIPTYELVDNYYDIIFTSVGNKNKPFNMSKVNFKLKEYNLKDDTEKGIFFLKCMDYCGKEIWGYINIVNPANTIKAFENISKYPKFDGRPYYQYSDFYFNDFEMNILVGKGMQSYKSYYLGKYYEVLMSHLLCIITDKRGEKEEYDLLFGSILNDRKLYKYTEYKQILEDIFHQIKTE